MPRATDGTSRTRLLAASAAGGAVLGALLVLLSLALGESRAEVRDSALGTVAGGVLLGVAVGGVVLLTRRRSRGVRVVVAVGTAALLAVLAVGVVWAAARSGPTDECDKPVAERSAGWFCYR